jgi:hypothetical protein
MIKSISIENFMSHDATLIELAPGVTVITGPNNVGKSAVVEAIRSLVQNPGPKHSIRHGAKQATVRLEIDSGEIIEWVRSEKAAFYRLVRTAESEGETAGVEEFHKIGQSVPENITALLRLGPVQTESGEIDIHIGNQREPIFLLSSPGSYAASFFAASTEAEYLLRMRQALKSRVDIAKATCKGLAAESKIAESGLLHYQPLDLLEPDVEKAGRLFESICRSQKSIPELDEAIRILADREEHLFLRSQSAAVLETVEPPPRLQEVAVLESLLDQCREKVAQARLAADLSLVLVPLAVPPVASETANLAHLVRQVADAGMVLELFREEQDAMTRLEGPPEIDDLTGLQQLLNDVLSCDLRGKRLRENCDSMAGLGLPPDLGDVSDLPGIIEDLAHAHAGLRLLTASYETMASLCAVPEAVPTGHLEDLIREMAEVNERISQTEQNYSSVDRTLRRKRQEMEQLIRETGVCPLCGSPMDISHILEGMHG